MKSLKAFLRSWLGWDAVAYELAALKNGVSDIAANADLGAAFADIHAEQKKTSASIATVREHVHSLHQRLDGVQHANGDIFKVALACKTHLDRLTVDAEDRMSDLMDLSLGRIQIPRLDLSIDTVRAVAFNSPDHLEPRGTINDNTRHPRFVRRCESLLREIRHLDVGCAGGGLVWDFTIRGHLSVGIEGSDSNLKNQRAEWRVIPDRLFCADVCFPFTFSMADRTPQKFNLVTAWELFEHIPTENVDDAIANILANMSGDGMLVCSIATFLDVDEVTGTIYHQTVRPKEWWVERFERAGLFETPGLFETSDFVRGSGNPRAGDWNVLKNPEMGFHLSLQRR